MSTYAITGNGYHRSSQDLIECLHKLPRFYKPVEQAIDEPAYRTDEKERLLTQAISTFVKNNPSLFKQTILEEKIAIIFDAYRDAYLEVLREDQNYQEALQLVNQSPIKVLGLPKQLEQAVEWLVLERLKIFHSTTPANAIHKYMGLKFYPSFTDFPDTYAYRDCNRGALINFFKNSIKI